MTCSDHTTLDGRALRHAPLRLLDLESVCSGRSDQSDWLYQVRPSILEGVVYKQKAPMRYSPFWHGGLCTNISYYGDTL